MQHQFTLNSGLVPLFEEKLEAFKKKFNKYGNTNLVYQKSEPYLVTDDSKFKHQLVVDITIDAAYQIQDFEFVAVLDWDETSKQNLILKASEDIVVPAEYKTSLKCEHCNMNRARLHTILLQNTKTNKYVQVGRSCVKDYLGKDIADYGTYLSFFSTLEDYAESLENKSSSGSIQLAFTPDEVLLQTIEYVKHYGYISKAQCWEEDSDSTSSMVYRALNHITSSYSSKVYQLFDVTDDDKEYLKVVKKYLEESTDTSDYVYDLKILANKPYVENKNLGLVVSIIGWYLRTTAKAKEQESTANSTYLGSVGDKIEITATPKCISSYESEYGISYIYKFITDDGNVVIWKTGKGLEDARITLKGTIKNLQEFRGTKQTEITRCKIQA